MENASKALIMAGSILIALIVISLLVTFFNQARSLRQTEAMGEQVQQAAEFNKPYTAYDREVYGSELLSIANKVEDYNKRESERKDYTRIELEVVISNDLDATYLKRGTYTSAQLVSKIKDMEEKIKVLGSKSISFRTETGFRSSRKISQLVNMRTKDIEELGTAQEDYKTLVNEYNTYQLLFTGLKTKVFASQGFTYDKYTGRITKMTYKI